MLSEEEKKAIEYYSNKEVSFSVDFDTEKLLKALGITEEDSFENHQIRFKTLLNLIAKLQKENEHWKNGFEKELEDNRKNTCELLKQDLIIRKKDKQINLMAKKLNQAYFDEDKFFKWFEKMMGVQEKMDYGYVVDLIKQYFERKVEKFKLINNKKQNT